MPREQMNWIAHKLYHKQHMMFKAFLINIVLMLLVWLICKTGMFDGMMTDNAGYAELVKFQAMGWMAIWKIANVVLFLVPAIAAWWERKCIESYDYRSNRKK